VSVPYASGGQRERNSHRRASSPFSARPVLDSHRAVVLVDDALDDREAQSRSLWLGRDVGLEDSLDDGVGKTAAVVADAQPYPAAGELGRDFDPRVAAAGQGVLRVLQK